MAQLHKIVEFVYKNRLGTSERGDWILKDRFGKIFDHL